MRSNILELENSVFVIVDVQEAFRNSVTDFAEIARKIAVFAAAAKLLKLPILITEQYPKGLGKTAPEILAVLPVDIEFIEKTAFSSCGARTFEKKIEGFLSSKQLIVAGIEAHVCVNQTVHDLLARGFEVHVLIDCIASRTRENKEIAVAKMQASGAIMSSLEMALFELMRDAQHEQFKAVQKLIK